MCRTPCAGLHVPDWSEVNSRHDTRWFSGWKPPVSPLRELCSPFCNTWRVIVEPAFPALTQHFPTIVTAERGHGLRMHAIIDRWSCVSNSWRATEQIDKDPDQ